MVLRPSHFDVPYGIASPDLTVGKTIIATTASDYFGFNLIAAATIGNIVVYDSIAASTGNRLDFFTIATGESTRPDRFFIVKARKGIVVSVTGAGASAVVFYGPKG